MEKNKEKKKVPRKKKRGESPLTIFLFLESQKLPVREASRLGQLFFSSRKKTPVRLRTL